MAAKNKPTKEQFLERIFPVTESGCWIWVGSIRDGYGNFNKHSAHRISYEIFNGSIPDGMCVCHRCDVPICVNPSHLFLGTHKENMKDMEQKGRKWKAVVLRKSDGLPASAKLNKENVIQIKRLLASKVPQSKIAAIFKVSQGAISFIKRGETWKDL